MKDFLPGEEIGDTRIFADEKCVGESKKIYKREDGFVLSVSHKRSEPRGAMVIETSIENHGEKTVTMEMLTSVLLKKIKADKIYRLQSFWSAEGMLKIDTIKALDMEHSWSDHGYRVEKFGNLGTMPVRRYFPFVTLEDSNTGFFTGVMLYAPSSWQIELLVKEGDYITISGGLADRDSGQL